MRAALRALLLAALVATAGCSGVFGDDQTAARETTAGDADSTPPGLTEAGLTDTNALVDAHAETLENRSLTLQERGVQRYENGTLRWRENQTVRVAANRTRYLLVTDEMGRPIFGGDGNHVEIFADGDRLYRSVRTPNSSWADVVRTADGDAATPRSIALDPARTDDTYVLLNVFDASGSESVRQQSPDSRRYYVETSDLELPGLLASHLELDAVQNATLTVVVTADGRIEEYRVEFGGTQDGTVVRGERTLWYEAVGETTVEVPDWLDDVEDRDGAGGDSGATGNATATTQAS